MAARIGHWVVGAFDGRQQGQLQRHVALFETLDDVMDVEAAAIAGAFEERRVTGEPQALLFDAWVDGNAVLQLEALAHALPDVLGRGWLLHQDDRFLLHSCRLVVRPNTLRIRDVTGALTADQSGRQGNRDGLCQARQCVWIEGFTYK
ncbi:hypothetical protein D3C80_851570 [compost metagenome]